MVPAPPVTKATFPLNKSGFQTEVLRYESDNVFGMIVKVKTERKGVSIWQNCKRYFSCWFLNVSWGGVTQKRLHNIPLNYFAGRGLLAFVKLSQADYGSNSSGPSSIVSRDVYHLQLHPYLARLSLLLVYLQLQASSFFFSSPNIVSNCFNDT